MTRIGWLADKPSFIGGAELTQAEFRAAAPDGIEIVDCPIGEVDEDCDAYAIHNCISYGLDDLAVIADKPATRYWNDVGNWYSPDTMGFLNRYAWPICCSPLQAEYMGFHNDCALVPPPVDLERFERAALSANGRAGAVSIGSWRNIGKGVRNVQAWANGQGVDFYGPGAFAPAGSLPVAQEDMPDVLARYRTFVFLPSSIEPFGRVVAEAWAAGCELVVNDLIGALHWIENDPDQIRTAAEDYWAVVLRDLP